MLLLERHAARCSCRQLLDLVLALLTSAPHSLDKAGLVVDDVGELVHVRRGIGMALHMSLRRLVHILLDSSQHIRRALRYAFQ